MSASLWPHGLQRTLSPQVCSNLCPLSQWCYRSIPSSATHFFCLQSFPASGSFPVSQFFTSDGQNIGNLWNEISRSSEYSGLISFRIDWLDLLAVQGTLKSLLQHHGLKASILWHSDLFMVQLSLPYMTTGIDIALTICTFVGKVMSLLLNTLSRFVIAFLPRSKRLLISWLQSLSTVILEPKKIKSITASTFSLLFATKWWDWMPWSSFFECWVLSQLLHSPLSPSSRGFLDPLHFLLLEWYHLHS